MLDFTVVSYYWVSILTSIITLFLGIGLFVFARNTKKLEEVSLHRELKKYYIGTGLTRLIDQFLRIHGDWGSFPARNFDDTTTNFSSADNGDFLLDITSNVNDRKELWIIMDKLTNLCLFMDTHKIRTEKYALVFYNDFFLLDSRIHGVIPELEKMSGEDRFDHMIPRYKKLVGMMKGYRKRYFGVG